MTFNTQTILILLIWLFNISGIIGIALGYTDWFLPLTPLNLMVYLSSIVIMHSFSYKTLLYLLIPFCIGMLTEYLGVQYGLIFGSYSYGANLGYKILGVPLMIGVNWAVLVYTTAAIARKIIPNTIFVSSFIGATLMVVLDTIIEISAPRFDFWEFKDGIVPLQNYIGWLGTAFIAHFWFQKLVDTYHFKISLHIFIAILVFFSTFLFV